MNPRLAALEGKELEVVQTQLDAYDIDADGLAIEELPQGCDNLNISFSCRGGRFVSRIYAITEREDIAFELDLIGRLVAAGFPTARAFRTRSGALSCDVLGFPTALFEFVAGRHIDEHRADSRQKVASLLADLHRLTVGMEIPQRRTISDLSRLKGLRAALQRRGDVPGRRGVEAFLAEADQAARAYSIRVRAASEVVRSGIIHHDTNAMNILVNDSDDIVALLDFDEAHRSELVMDLAAFFHVWCTAGADEQLDCEAVRAALRNYEEKAPLSPGELGLLPEAILLNFAAEAAEYLRRKLDAGRASVDVGESTSWRAFSRLCASTDWRDEVIRGG